MFAKVHPAEDVKSGNTGSCHDLVRYLEKETGEGQRFFSHTEQDISPERVIMGEFYQFNLSSCIRQQNSLTAQFVSFSLSNLANIFYPPPIFTIINLCLL